MKIIDYRMTPEVLSWFRYAGIPIDDILSLRKISTFSTVGRSVISRVLPKAAFSVTHPIPEFNVNFDQTFPDLMDGHAAALLAEGKLIRLAWSGGLDSTGALLALKQAGATAAQVEVIYTDESVEEYPALMPFVEQNFTPVKVLQPTPDTSGDTLWVSGEGGDFLFMLFNLRRFLRMQTGFGGLPWEEYFFEGNVGDSEKMVARAVMAQCPFPIVNVEQAQWWKNFGMCWQNLYYRMGSKLDTTMFNAFVENHRPFYMSDLWQQWSMKRMATKTFIDTDFWMFKKPLKDYIHSVFPDQNYYDTKASEGSLRVGISETYVRFEDGSTPSNELDFRAKVAE